MKVEELRFGNLIQWTDHEGNTHIGTVGMLMPEQIGFIELGGVAVRLLERDKVLPVVITRDLLVKMGFEGIHGLYTKRDFSPSFETDNGSLNLVLELYAGYQDTLPCDYIHQLQNIYFAYKGEELTYKL